jgi:aromatic amino acid aminotransferase I
MHSASGISNGLGTYSASGTGSIPCQTKAAVLQDLGKLKKTLAPITTADFFKASWYSNLSKSGINVDRFLGREGRVRQPSSLKASASGLGKDVISLSTGRPLPDTFPFDGMEFVYPSPSPTAWIDQGPNIDFRGSQEKENKGRVFIHKQDPSASIDLSIALSYGYSLGSEQLIQYLTTHVSHVHSPPYSDWEICLTAGNTQALETALRNFTDRGGLVLVEDYTYSGMIEAATALGLVLVPVPMDTDGLNPDSLDKILSTWDLLHPGKPAPRVLYTIPTGHNPTGITQPRHRRQEILKVADKHDILIIEDDPYYYLYFQQIHAKSSFPGLPSYLSLSTTGRVIRLDSTSKILAPGLRLGWLTASKAIVQTFQAAHDLGIVHPSGLSQLVVYKLVSDTWGHDGFLQYLDILARTYRDKSTAMLQAMERELGRGLLADICSWGKIHAGMFVWLRIDCTKSLEISGTLMDRERRYLSLADMEDRIYTEALKEGVLVCKGSFFRTPTLTICPDVVGNHGHSSDMESVAVFLRLTFASADVADLVKAVERLRTALLRTFIQNSCGYVVPES